MLNEAFFEDSPAPLNQPEFQAAVHAAQIKALYHAPAIMLVNPINASFLAAVLACIPGVDPPALDWLVLRCGKRSVHRSRALFAATG